MNKTVTINISGLIFNIDEKAYDKLKNYLSSIESYFSNSVGGEEILADIEGRIAEMFNERMSSRKEVISLQDVDYMVSIMGQPEDFVDEETREENERKNKEAEENNSDDQDSSQNAGKSYDRGPKRFFRDPDGRIVGGVCSGIGYYFGIDPVIIRLLFVGAVLLGFSGILVYIVFWIITPKAQTRAEKLQMRGRKVNIDNIRQTVKKEAADVKKNFSHIEGKVDEFASGEQGKRIGGFVNDLGKFLVMIFGNALKVVGKLLGIALMIFGGIFLVSLFSSIVGFATWDGLFTVNGVMYNLSMGEATSMLFASSWIGYVSATGLAIIIGIPILFLILIGAKIVFGVKELNKMVGLGLFLFWILGFILCLVGGTAAISDFSKEDRTVQEINLAPSFADTITITSNEGLLPFGTDRTYPGDFMNLIKADNSALYLANVKFNVVENNSDSIKITVLQKSRGGSYKDAKIRSENIEFSYGIEEGSLILDPFYKVLLSDKYRLQELFVTLSIPQGKTVYFDKSSSWVVYDVKNVTSTRDRYMLEKYWTMTDEGLSCLHCSVEETTNPKKTQTKFESMNLKELERQLLVFERELNLKKYEYEHKMNNLQHHYEKKMARLEEKIRTVDNKLKVKEYGMKLEELQSEMQFELKKLEYKLDDEERQLEETMREVEDIIQQLKFDDVNPQPTPNPDPKPAPKTSEKQDNNSEIDLTSEEENEPFGSTRLLFPNPFRILI